MCVSAGGTCMSSIATAAWSGLMQVEPGCSPWWLTKYNFAQSVEKPDYKHRTQMVISWPKHIQYNKAWTQWLTFADDITRCIFSERKFWYFDSHFTKACFRGPVDKKSAMVQVTAWCQTGDMSLSKPMVTKFHNSIWHPYYSSINALFNSTQMLPYNTYKTCTDVSLYPIKDSLDLILEKVTLASNYVPEHIIRCTTGYPRSKDNMCRSMVSHDVLYLIQGKAMTSKYDPCSRSNPRNMQPRTCITTAIWHWSNPFRQWQRSFQWKLRSHWLKRLRQNMCPRSPARYVPWSPRSSPRRMPP